MSFYLRKAIGVGPLRFSLSKSGVGVSVGVKGFRVGSGPRGNYVQMGRGGIYYRKTLPSGGGISKQTPYRLPEEDKTQPAPYPDVAMQTIESADVGQMTNSSSAELLQEIANKHKRIRLFPICASVTGVLLFLLLTASQSLLLVMLAGIVLVPLTIYSFFRDQLAKTTVLLYQIDSHLEPAFATLHASALQLAVCSGCWRINATGAVRDAKYYAGASAMISRHRATISKSSPPFLKTNVETISMVLGRISLYFLPDHILVYGGGKVGAIEYNQLQVDVSQTKFIESNGAPPDATVVDRTWQYINKSGGPDRRFSSNRELPVCLYDEIHLSSATGLNEILQVSRPHVGESLASSIRYMAQQLAQASKSADAIYRIGRNGEDLGELPFATIMGMMNEGSLTKEDYYYDIQTDNWEQLSKLVL